MSNSKTFEANTIEEALVAAAREFGPDVEVADAQKHRRGGVLGFFAKEYFEVTAVAPAPRPAAESEPSSTAASDFARVLQQMAAEVNDTVDLTNSSNPTASPAAPTPTPAAPTNAPRTVAAPLPRRLAPRPETTAQEDIAHRAVGLIDLRRGRRLPVDPLVPTDAHGRAVRERPSQLRRRLIAGATTAGGTGPLTREVSGPVLDLRDSTPDWSIERLSRMGLGDHLLELVAAFEPDSDLEWVQALATAIRVQMPDVASTADKMLAGEGRASAVGLVQAMADGQVPAFLFVDGQKIPATPDELALSIRECLR